MGGFYMAYLESLCRRRGWRDPLYETYRSSSGYTCLVLVHGREYRTDLTYETGELARETAAMRAFMICRNFSVNGGMLARNGIVQGLPANEYRSRHSQIRLGSRGSVVSISSGSSSGESTYSDTSLFSLPSVASSSSTASRASHNSEDFSSPTTGLSTSRTATNLSSFEKTPPSYGPSLMESTVSDENLGIDRPDPLKLGSGEDILDLVDFTAKVPERSTKLVDDETDETKGANRIQNESCEYDFYRGDFRSSVKTRIWPSTSPSSVVAPKGRILIEQSISQYFVHADIADEGFWEGNDDSDQFLKQYNPHPLPDEPDLKIEGNSGGIDGLGNLTADNPRHESAKVNIEIEKISVDLFEQVVGTSNETSKCRLNDDAGKSCSDCSSCTGDTDPGISEWDESDSQASFYQRCTISREAEGLEQFSRPILDRERRRLVDRVMEEFWVIFGDSMFTDSESLGGSVSLVAGDQVSSDGNDTARTTRASFSFTGDQVTPSGEQKRKRDEQEESENDNNKRKQHPPERPILPSAGVNSVRFACPFRKHNPRIYNMYTHRSCTLSGWTTIARIKEHIYRSHRKKPYCQRCWLNFDNQQQLDLHMTVSAAEICEVKSGQPPDGITAEHERRLRSRKKTRPSQSDTDTWRDIYRILFPGEEVPSPYFEFFQEDVPFSPDASELANYEDYIRRELPSLVRRNLEETVYRETQPLEASLIASLVDIVRDSQEPISRSYRRRRETGGGSQTLGPQSATLSETSAPNRSERPPATDDQFSLGFLTPIVEAPTIEEWGGVNMSATDFHLPERSIDQLSHDSGYGSSLRSCSCRRGACSCQSVQNDNPEISMNGTLPAAANPEQGNELLEFMSFPNYGLLDFAECDDDLYGMDG